MGVRVRLETTTKQRHALLSHAGAAGVSPATVRRWRDALLSHAGAARFAYNWGLELRQKAYSYAGGHKENAISLHKL